MTIIAVILLSIVEGITEFLPVSSTGHLILASRLLELSQTEFLKSFEIAIQLGAILSVVVLYWRSLLVNIATLKRLVIAFIPTGLIGLVLYKFLKNFLLGNGPVVLWALLVGGVFIIIFELIHKEKSGAIDKTGLISYGQAFLIGIFQSIAIVPGVSRSAATIIGGLALGLKRRTIVEFSFLLAVPTMAAATVLDLTKSAFSFTPEEVKYLLAGFILSFIFALLAIKLFLAFIKNHTFIWFGIYRIILALLLWKYIRP